jgi:basic amino acid/polyamine antiporter, APA family
VAAAHGDGEAAPTDLPAGDRPVLPRVIGLRDAITLGVGGTIGGGVFVLIGAAAEVAGPAVLLSFLLAFVASLLIAMPYAELATRYPLAGGGYAVVRGVLGRWWGFLMGWAYWGAYLGLSGFVTLGFGGYLERLTGVPVLLGAGLLITAATAMNLLGLKLSSRAQGVILAAAAAALIAFAVVGAFHVRGDLLTPLMPAGWGGLFAGALLTFLSLNGYDVVAAAGEEIRHPERNLPLAMLGTLVLVLVLYLGVALAAVGTVPWQSLGDSASPLADVAGIFLGEHGRVFMAIAAVLTTAATGNAVLVVCSRISFAMARDGLLPAPLARVSGRGVPSVAILVTGGFLVAVAATGSVRFASSSGGWLYLVHFVLLLAALVALRRRGGTRAAFRMPLPRVVIPLAFVACAVLFASAGPIGTVTGVVWLAVGAAGYRLAGRPGAKAGRIRDRETVGGIGGRRR